MTNDRTPPLKLGDRVAVAHPRNAEWDPAIVLAIKWSQDEGEVSWWADFHTEHGEERGRLVDPASVAFPEAISSEDRARWAPIWGRLAASCTGPAERHWEARGHYEAADGHRVSIMECNGRWAVAFSYKAPEGMPQFFEYEGERAEVRARYVFEAVRRRATEAAPLAYDSREAWVNVESL